MSLLAERTGAINLGQGFPDADGPAIMAEAAIDAIRHGHNQYPPGLGTPDLRRAIAAHQLRFYGLDHDPDTEVLVTAGATEAITAAVLALCEPNDEVVMFEPASTPTPSPAGHGRAATRLGVVGGYLIGPADVGVRHRRTGRGDHRPADPTAAVQTPAHNPTGARSSMPPSWPGYQPSYKLRRRRPRLVVNRTEVYEHLVFEGEHVPLASLPGWGAVR